MSGNAHRSGYVVLEHVTCACVYTQAYVYRTHLCVLGPLSARVLVCDVRITGLCVPE